MNSTFTNWKSYWQKEQYINYKLHDSEFVQTFFTNNSDLDNEYNLFYLNRYLGELPMFYYIWKNNLKSEFIAISQYHRDICNIDFELIHTTNRIQSICVWPSSGDTTYESLMNVGQWENFMADNWYDSVKEALNLSDKEIEDIKRTVKFEQFAIFVLCCKWEQFCKLCEIIFGFLDKCFPNDGWKDIETLENFRKKQLDSYIKRSGPFDGWNFLVDKRYLLFFIECACRCTLDRIFRVFCVEPNRQSIVCDLHGIDYTVLDLGSFIRANAKTGATISLINGGKTLEDNIRYLYNEYYFDPVDVKLNKDFEDCVRIEFDEYIETDSAFDFSNKKYKIKKR